jgi:carbon starvation protein
MVAPTVEWAPLNAPPMIPLLFITIACGAISGFHCLVSSGTTSKQLKRETDATFVGYGSMLTEGFLAVIVILAVSAGIGLGWPGAYGSTGTALWSEIYGDWAKADFGLGTKVGAFVAGAANFLTAIGISQEVAIAIMGVLVASFAGTTLDTATRLQRYVIQELSGTVSAQIRVLRPVAAPFSNMYVATGLAVVSSFALAMMPYGDTEWGWSTAGTGGQTLWPMFGATNQLLGGLAFLVICFWLWRRNKPVWFAAIPGAFMLVMPVWGMLLQLGDWVNDRNYVLVFIAVATIGLQVWMVIEAVRIWPRVRGVLEEALPRLPSRRADKAPT